MVHKIVTLLPQKFVDRFKGSSERSQEVVKNIIVSVLVKGFTILTSLLIVPMTINYVNPTQYGIWLTLSGIIGWMSFFDLGLGNGFRNRFAEAKANNNLTLAREYVSTTYFAIGSIVTIVLLLFLFINQYIDWSNLLNVEASYQEELQRIAIVVCTFTGLNMIVGIFRTLVEADQKHRISSLIQAGSSLCSLLSIWILTKVSHGSLFNLALYFSSMMCIVTAITSVVMYRHSRYRIFAPSIRYIRPRLIRDILNLGGQFFIIYLCLIACFSIMNIVISREVGPFAVTQYNIANKYFGIIYMVFALALTPLWSSFTDAYTKKDYIWMRSTIKRLERIWFIAVLVCIVMLLLSPLAYQIWIGDSVNIPLLLSALTGIYILSQTLGAIYMHAINGIGCIRIQTIIYVLMAIGSWPALTYSCREWGVIGIVLYPSLVYLTQSLLGKIQIHKILNKRAIGIWSK